MSVRDALVTAALQLPYASTARYRPLTEEEQARVDGPSEVLIVRLYGRNDPRVEMILSETVINDITKHAEVLETVRVQLEERLQDYPPEEQVKIVAGEYKLLAHTFGQSL